MTHIPLPLWSLIQTLYPLLFLHCCTPHYPPTHAPPLLLGSLTGAVRSPSRTTGAWPSRASRIALVAAGPQRRVESGVRRPAEGEPHRPSGGRAAEDGKSGSKVGWGRGAVPGASHTSTALMVVEGNRGIYMFKLTKLHPK